VISDRFVIVGNGPSAAGYTPPDDVTVIAVNGAIDWLPRADYWFTLDPSPENMVRMRERKPNTVYYCANEGNQESPRGVMRLDRVSQKGGREPFEKDTPEWYLWRWGGMLGLSEDSRKIHSGNSAYGALGLAYHLGAKKVLLVGVDGTQEPKLDGKIPRNLSHLPILFESAKGQIDFKSIGFLPVNKTEEEEGKSWLIQ